jgi:hypothetical protein
MAIRFILSNFLFFLSIFYDPRVRHYIVGLINIAALHSSTRLHLPSIDKLKMHREVMRKYPFNTVPLVLENILFN